MSSLVFHRYRDVETPYVELVEPASPTKKVQRVLAKLGFEIYPDDGLWWVTLPELGRRNMSAAAIESLLREGGLDAHVAEAPATDDIEPSGEPDDEDADLDDEMDGEGDTLAAFIMAVSDEESARTVRVDRRVLELTERVEELEAANRALLAMIRPLLNDSGDAGRRILVDEDEPASVFEGRSIYFDRVRGIPVAATPEEAVRQRVLRHLEDHLGVPGHSLFSEWRLPRSANRADIVVHIPDEEDGGPHVLAVIECKAPGVPLNDDVWAQAEDYGRKLGARYVGITDGVTLHARRRSAGGDGWLGVRGFPTFQMMLEGRPPPPSLPRCRSIPRPDYRSLADYFHLERYSALHAVVAEPIDDDWTYPELLINLASLLLDTREGPEGMSAAGWVCTADRGMVDTSFGNAGYSSHAYRGNYRALTMQHPEHGDVLPLLRTWSQSSGSTMLALGLHHLDGRKHHVVQLNLKRGLVFDDDEDTVTLVHDGRMSKGGGGSFKRAEVLAQVQRVEPDLIEGDVAVLGTFPTDRLITWEDAFPVFVNLLRFGLAADALRTN